MEAPNLADKSESGGGKKEETVGGEKAITAGARQEEKDALEETLLCIICQEILHDCVR